jgi:hypothetical protein
VWDYYQRSRLDLERSELATQHSGFSMELTLQSAVIRGWCSGGTQSYWLRVEVPSEYPDAKPHAYVEYPKPLKQFGGVGSMNDLAPSHEYHLLSPSSTGETQICHYGGWDASKSLHLVSSPT